ncbi:hypothetical protein Cgig2_019148 [Carnegiea gigantea]|uniref:Uncharacterized protein n=1 Tax=Carnegiea gigantea TaxID=171969 RepID=A0A9Q1Q703_9CARY|nr:hypothetical protein Cgig2_019148 [Carnegiea gigantea]
METKVKRSNFAKVVENFQEWEHYVNYESHDRELWQMPNGLLSSQIERSSSIQKIHQTIDHYLGVLSFFEIHEQGRKAFSFFDMWATDPQFPQIVRDVWSTSIQGTKMFAISKKLELLQHPLRKLNKEVLYAKAKNALNDIMVHIQQQPQNKLLYIEEKVAMENVQTWKQRLDSFY